MSIVIGQKSINQIAQYMVESWRGFWMLLSTSGTFTRPSGDFQRVFILGDPGEVSWAGRKGATKVFKYRRKSSWVPTLTRPFPNGQVNAGSWLGTKNALYYGAQSANSISVLFVSSYTTAIDSITACLAHAPKKFTQSGIFQFDINATFQNTGSLYIKSGFVQNRKIFLQKLF